MTLTLLLLLGLSGTLAAPTDPAASPFLEGLDDFLAAFDGLALPGDPVAKAPAAADPPEAMALSPAQEEPEVVTEVAPCLGCVEEVEAVGADYRRVAQLAAELLEEELNMTQVTEVTQVYRAARQVVNGIKYFLTLELVPTNCSRPRGEGDECAADAESAAQLYSVEILEHPQQELGVELLFFEEVSPEEVADLPGLLTAPEPPSPSDSSPTAAEEQPGVPSFEADLADMISDVEKFAVPAAPETV